MKQSLYLSILLLLLCLSCEDTLTETPNSSYDKESFFSSAEKAEMAVMGIYSSLSDYRHYGWYEMAAHASDDTYYTARTHSDNTIHDMAHYRLNATNEWVLMLWQLKYEGIGRANLAIDGIRRMSGYATNPELQALEAEARFLRAFLAFDLVKGWGDVPFKTTYTASYDDAFTGRVPREEIYDAIVEDLDFAIAHTEWATASSSPERVSQGAARALLMRICLQRAGYSLQADGKLARPEASVRSACFQRVIEQWEAFQQQGYHNFYPDGFEALFRNFSEGSLNSVESLFEVAIYHAAGSRNGGAWGIYNGPQVAEATGVSSSEAGNYMGRANGFFITVPEWRPFFEEGDQRRDVTICTHRWIWDAANKQHVAQERTAGSWYPGKWRREWMPASVWGKNMNYGDVNFCPLRYADVVLMAAEAYNETGETAQAWALLNRVRQRAGATPVTTVNYARYYKSPQVYDLPFISDADEQGRLRTALYWERGFELSFEGQRKFDLIRWGILGDALQLFGSQSAVNQGATKAYPAYQNFVSGQHELFPIPLKELQSNPLLGGKNNPGY